MSTSVRNDAAPLNDVAADSGQPLWAKYGWGWVALGFAPLLVWHVLGLLAKPHYQFILFLPLGFWMLATSRDRDEETGARLRSKTATFDLFIGMALVLLSLAGLALATWGWSPWVAAVSAMIAAAGCMLVYLGRLATRSWLPIWLFCWILIPLPFGLDEDLIVRLRGVTTEMSSRVLDQIGILHQSYANVIALPSKTLFIADACSGIHSLYVLVAVAFFTVIFMRRGIVHSAFLLTSTFGFVLLENVARIVLVAISLGYRMDWSEGTNHTILGVVLFCVSAGLIASMDQLLLFLLPERIGGWLPWSDGSAGNPNSLVTGESRTAAMDLGWFRSPMVLGGVALFPLLGVAQLFRAPAAPNIAAAFASDLVIPVLGEEALPKKLGEFERVDFETIERVPGDPFGKSSQRWIYRRGTMTAGISLDYPYEGVKDMCPCYEATGWQLSDQELVSADESATESSDAAAPFGESKLHRDLFGNGMILFSSFDLTGATSVVIKTLAKQDAGEQIASRWLDDAGGESSRASNPPYIQVHLFARDHAGISAESEQELHAIYRQAREILREGVLSRLRE